MELMTKEIEKELEKNPLYSHDGEMKKAKVIVKYFNPYGAGTWLITEGEKQEDGDWLLFGYCHIHCWEWGYVLLSDLKDLKFTPWKLGIERDLHCEGCTVEDLVD